MRLKQDIDNEIKTKFRRIRQENNLGRTDILPEKFE